MVYHSSAHRDAPPTKQNLREFFDVFRYTKASIRLVWQTSHRLLIALALLTVIGGLLPAGLAYVSKLIIDSVLKATETGLESDQWQVAQYIGIELIIVMLIAGVQRGLSVSQSLLRAMLGFQVNVIVLEKALSLELAQFEDPAFYDKMTQARRGASTRPLGLINKTFGLIQNAIALFTYGALLYQFSIWTVLILLLAALPAFFGETKFSGDAFRLFRWRVPETREQNYLEMVIAREESAKEVKLFGLGKVFLNRYKNIFQRLFREDRNLTIRRGAWGFGLGLISTLALYGAYGWIAWETVMETITLGDMTMYLLLFKQGQATMTAGLSAISGMYEDNLYLSNLYEFLDYQGQPKTGSSLEGTNPNDGIRFENVSFTYPGQEKPALKDISFHLK
ncbi:MAG: ABC transporter ATP-binding protein, partial [Myxococcota bacterium]|nr:ABC transporter ATP-binding protein [Myxococcota bacterium]